MARWSERPVEIRKRRVVVLAITRVPLLVAAEIAKNLRGTP